MKRLPLFCVVALLGAAVSAPAQILVEGRIGRHVRGSISLGHHEPHYRAAHREPVRHLPYTAPLPVHGHWQTVREPVLIPGYWQEQHVPPTYGWVSDRCGRVSWGVVDPGGCRSVWVPERYEQRTRRVWVTC